MACDGASWAKVLPIEYAGGAVETGPMCPLSEVGTKSCSNAGTDSALEARMEDFVGVPMSERLKGGSRW